MRFEPLGGFPVITNMKLLDICETIVDCPHSTAKDEGKGYPLIRTPNVGKGRLKLEGVHRVSENVYNIRNERAVPQENDLILAREAPVGNVAIIKQGQIVCLGQRTVLIRPNRDIVDPDFLVYYLLSPKLQHRLLSTINGATVSHLNMSSIRSLEVEMPDIDVQQKIGAILARIDDKIELDNRINANLEQQAQAIFKSWFVDFETFGGKMPKEWKKDKLGSFVEIKRGGSPRPIQDYLSEKGYRWLKISDVTSLNSPYILEIKEHIREEGLKKTVFLKQGSLVLSNSATPGIPKILDVDSCIHDGWLYFPDSQLSNEYLYLLFTFIRNDLVKLGNGSVFTNLKTDILRQFEIIMPTGLVLSEFQDIITPLFEMVKNNTRENQRLAVLRDALLPKLMNGEIDVSAVHI